jgi:hypothetical protein
MRNESIGVIDQVGPMAQLLASAERELSAFVTAVNQLFGAEQGWKAANNWIEELERTDWPSGASVIDWRKVTIAAAARLVRVATVNSVTVKDEVHAPTGSSRQSLGLQDGIGEIRFQILGIQNDQRIE